MSTPIASGKQYDNHEARYAFDYPQGYRPRSVSEQVKILTELLPDLKVSLTELDRLASRPLPEGMDWFAIPRWEKIAETYNKALLELLRLMLSTRKKSFDYNTGILGERHFRQTDQAIAAWRKLGEEQKGDILIVAAQFGLNHRGRSGRHTREVMLNSNEFGLGAFAVGCMLLTHPEREVQWKQLHVYCVGDESSLNYDGKFDGVPIFCFYEGKLRFEGDSPGNSDRYFGSASSLVL